MIVTTEGEEHAALATLAALVPAAAAGVVRDVILVDRGGSDAIARLADIAGCAYLATPGSRAGAMAAGAAQTRSPWLMFMPAGAIPDPGWIDETSQFVQSVAGSGVARAGIFSPARSLYANTGWRDLLRTVSQLLGRPSPNDGLLIARDHYERLGGYRAGVPETRILRRLDRASRVRLRSRVVML